MIINPDRSHGTIYEHFVEVKLKNVTKVDNPEQADSLDTFIKTDIFSIDVDFHSCKYRIANNQNQ